MFAQDTPAAPVFPDREEQFAAYAVNRLGYHKDNLQLRLIWFLKNQGAGVLETGSVRFLVFTTVSKGSISDRHLTARSRHTIQDSRPCILIHVVY